MAEELFKQARLGMDAEAFLASDLGRYLVKKADDELQAAYDGFLELKPSDTDGLLALQSKANNAINFKYWLAEAVQAGRYSIQELEDE